jgi:hypothetical protein
LSTSVSTVPVIRPIFLPDTLPKVPWLIHPAQ